MTTSRIPLTSLAKAAGCAAKIGQADLRQALANLPEGDDPRVLIGHTSSDDAAVIKLSEEMALVETVDIFPPIVDDPYDYGRIAAANALSDLYAMGATPLSALSFVAWPVEQLGLDALGEVLAGAATICAEAGITIAGGHSIVDEEPKFGIFCTGTAHPKHIVSNSGARAGDLLLLTKPLGTGILTTAVKRGAIQADGLQDAIASMTTLNRAAADAMMATGVNAATDVTGFGLLGHLGNLLRASSEASDTALGAVLNYAEIPLLPGVEAFAAAGLCPGGSQRNLAYAAPLTSFHTELTEHQQLILADAQTSGGLLIAVAPERLEQLHQQMAAHQVAVHCVIGSLCETTEAGTIQVNA